MNKKILYIACFALTLMGTSCENYDNLIPSEYDKILSLKESGEQALTLYNTGEDGEYIFTIMKGGNDPHAISSVDISIMDEVELASYSELVGKQYSLLPSELYEVKNSSLEFKSSDTFLKGSVVLKTTQIKDLIESNDLNYVLPLIISSKMDSINSQRNTVILQPNIVVPVISFLDKEATVNIVGDKGEYELQLALPFESLWDFECEVAVDEKTIPDYYELIKAEDYTIENNGKIEFKKGSKTSEAIKITFNNRDVFGSAYVLPLKISNISMDGFNKQESPLNVYGAYNKVPLTVDMLSTNAQETTEGPIENLIDGNPATYFHSSWSKSIDEAHYFQVKLNEALSMCRFDYQNRNNANGKPQEVKIMVSADGNNWEELAHLESGLPTGGGSKYSSQAYSAKKPFTYFRFVVYKTNGGSAPTFFNMAEFSLYGK